MNCQIKSMSLGRDEKLSIPYDQKPGPGYSKRENQYGEFPQSCADCIYKVGDVPSWERWKTNVACIPSNQLYVENPSLVYSYDQPPHRKDLLPCLMDLSLSGMSTQLRQKLDKVTDVCEVVNELLGNCGQTLLHLAVDRGHCDVARVLLLYGANPNILDSYGRSPLHYACIQRHRAEIAMLLLENDASPSVHDNYGNTPLHYAAENGWFGIICAMIAHHTNKGLELRINARNRNGETPIILAERWGHYETVGILSQHGACRD